MTFWVQPAACWVCLSLTSVHACVCGCVCRAVQAMVESLIKEFPNVLTLRVRMPIVADLTYERNFITKIIKYDKVGRCPG